MRKHHLKYVNWIFINAKFVRIFPFSKSFEQSMIYSDEVETIRILFFDQDFLTKSSANLESDPRGGQKFKYRVLPLKRGNRRVM